MVTARRDVRRLPWHGWTGLAGLVGGEIGLFLGTPAVRILFYCIAWWSYILLADAVVWRRRGDSLLRDRPWEFLVLAFWSIAVWNLFELINFRIQNWFYINVPTDFAQGAILSFFAYATVAPGIFETYDLLRAWGVADALRVARWRVRRVGLAICMGIGLAMLAAPLLWPRHAYPLVWGFAVFLLDPVCYLSGRTTSLLGHFEKGDPRPFVRLVLAGLICGALWEFWNYWAYTKWLYTVPFFEDAKWFEMPPLGFLGFPPFALECYVLVNLLNLFRHGRGWEMLEQRGPGASRRLTTWAVMGALVFNLGVYAGIDRFTVESTVPRLADLDAIPRPVADRLSAAGIRTPPDLLRHTETTVHVPVLAARAGLTDTEIVGARHAARLAELKGLGARNTNVLRKLGIATVEELARQDAVAVAARWEASGDRVPPVARVRIWVRAARAQAASQDPESPSAAPDQEADRTS